MGTLVEKIIVTLSILLTLGFQIAYISLSIKIHLKKTHNELPISFWNYTSFYLLTCIIPNVAKNEKVFSMFGSLPMFIFMISEVGFLIWIFKLCIINKLTSKLITTSLIVSLYFAIKTIGIYSVDNYSVEENVNFFFIFESFVASTASLIYFLELRTKISSEKVMDNPKTLLILGVFFCFLPPMVISVQIATTNYFGVFPEKIIPDRTAYELLKIFEWLLSSCSYLVLMLFINKALKKKQLTI